MEIGRRRRPATSAGFEVDSTRQSCGSPRDPERWRRQGGSLPRPDHHLTDGALGRNLWPRSEGWAARKYLDAAGTPALTDSSAALRDDAWLEIHVVDVAQGDGIWVHTFDDNILGNGCYEGKNVVIDGGPRSSDATDRRFRISKTRRMKER